MSESVGEDIEKWKIMYFLGLAQIPVWAVD